MAVTRAAFLGLFPEFEPATPTMIEGALAKAARAIDSTIFKERTDDAIGWLAAHYLAISPFGKQARLADKTGNGSSYQREYQKIAGSMVPSVLVV